MGVKSVLGVNPAEAFAEAIFKDKADELRRVRAARRVALYRDKTEAVLREEFTRIFKSAERRVRVEAFTWLASALGIFKRIINEVSAPVYNPPPTRLMRAPGDQAVLERIAKQVRLNRRMDLLTRVGNACGTAMLHWRNNPRLGLLLDVLTPDRYVVIPDPADPLRELGVAFAKEGRADGRRATHWVCWDDETAFVLNERGHVVTGSGIEPGQHPGVLPFVAVHMVERSGDYWEAMSSGADLEAAHTSVAYILAMTLRLHHTQGHGQVVINGDPGTFPRGQILDPESPLFAGAGNSGTLLYNPMSPDAALQTADRIITIVAANYGVDRERLNAQITAASTGVPMLERRAETLEALFECEMRSLEVAAVVSRSSADPDLRLAEGAEVEAIAFPDLSSKSDREKELRIRREEKAQGLRSTIDDKLEDSPELAGDREAAKKEIERAAQEESWRVQLYRTLGITPGASPDEPGQSQKDNGAMGAKVRDGEMSKDMAAKQAKTGPAPDADRVKRLAAIVGKAA